MLKQIGPTFPKELSDAGLGNGLSFTVGGTDDDIQGAKRLSSAQQSILQGVISAHDPAAVLPVVSDADRAENKMVNDPFTRALIKREARSRGIAPRQVMNEIRSDV